MEFRIFYYAKSDFCKNGNLRKSKEGWPREMTIKASSEEEAFKKIRKKKNIISLRLYYEVDGIYKDLPRSMWDMVGV